MPFVKWPGSVRIPPTRSDVDAEFWTPWTPQPGAVGSLYIRPLRAVEGPVDTTPLRPEAKEPMPEPSYLPSETKRSSVVKLRDYQKQALAALDTSWRKNNRAPLVVLPCGVGKTIIAAEAMSRAYLGRGFRSLFLAHRRELLDQTAAKIRLVSPRVRVGIVQARRDELGRDVTIASIQTIGNRSATRLDRVLENGPYDLIVCDEAHHAVSDQWTGVLDALREQNPSALLLGLTATPGRADGTALDLVFDDVCYQRNTFEMVDAGWLVPPKGFKVTLDLDLDRVNTREGDFVRSQLSKVMNTTPVNQAVVNAWMQYGHNRKTIVFGVDVAHATALNEMFVDAGYKAEIVHGKTKKRDRDAILKRFHQGDTKILVNVEVATEGFDIPSVEAILMARPTQSQTLWIQAIGRGLRPYPGKTECIVIDCVGNSERHRLVQLASIAGFDALNAPDGERRGNGNGEETIDDDLDVLNARMRGEEIELSRRPAETRYQWRETSLGWVLLVPRIGYYLLAWHHNGPQCVIRFYDQRPGRRDDPARTVVKDPVDFEMAYGLVESECDRIFNARERRATGFTRHGGRYERTGETEFEQQDPPDPLPPEISFVDLDEGTDEDVHVPEAWMLREANWRGRPATAKQLGLLQKLGVKEATMPDKAGEASDLIAILQVERDLKMRLPPTPKQIAYLRINGLPAAKTKGAAARSIWQHRKAQQS